MVHRSRLWPWYIDHACDHGTSITPVTMVHRSRCPLSLLHIEYVQPYFWIHSRPLLCQGIDPSTPRTFQCSLCTAPPHTYVRSESLEHSVMCHRAIAMTHVCVCVCVHVCINICKYVCVYIYAHTNTYTLSGICMCSVMNVQVYVHVPLYRSPRSWIMLLLAN
jgi:hypothetical protein